MFLENSSLRADPAQLSRLASATLAIATALTGSWRAGAGRLVAGPTGYGGDERLHQANVAAATAADVAVRRVLEVLAGDADRLWQTAFAYEEADERAARRTERGPLR
jgi:hypothetical protein